MSYSVYLSLPSCENWPKVKALFRVEHREILRDTHNRDWLEHAVFYAPDFEDFCFVTLTTREKWTVAIENAGFSLFAVSHAILLFCAPALFYDPQTEWETRSPNELREYATLKLSCNNPHKIFDWQEAGMLDERKWLRF